MLFFKVLSSLAKLFFPSDFPELVLPALALFMIVICDDYASEFH